HLHADHVSGGPALARDAGVSYHASPRDFEDAAVSVEGLADGQPGRIGPLEVLPIVPLGTPGHTPGSTSLLVGETFLLTGDTLFVDDVGRPDLGGQAAAWARDLHRTLHERLRPLGDAIVVLPAHATTLAGTDPRGAGRAPGEGTRPLPPALAGFAREAEHAAGTAPAEYTRIRAINLGRETAAESERTEGERGRSQGALWRR